MSIPFVNSIASWVFKMRIQQIELFLKYPHEVQNELLMSLTQKAKDTEFGQLNGFKGIVSYSRFSDSVPISTYEDYAGMIERSRKGEINIFWPNPIKWFAKSSGTTNSKSKFIPVSQDALDDCHYAASKDLIALYLNNNPESKLFDGQSLRLGGSKELYEENGTVFGDLSAILIDNLPLWAEFKSTPSSKVSLMSDWNVKLQAIVDETINDNVTSLAGVPSWMLVMLNHVLQTSGKNHLLEVWPNLEVYFHGGVSFQPYKTQYQNLVPNSGFKYYEIYNASEGFFAIQDQNDSSDLLLMLDYGIFYEFIPMSTFGTKSQKIIPLHEVELNKNYALVISTNSGLWRYLIGDTVRFTSLSPYRIRVTGRTKHHINAFGEELIIENADHALKKTCSETGAELVDYTAAPIFMEGKEKGAHEWLIEFKTPPKNMDDFVFLFDNALKSVNSDYEAKRANNMTLNPPVVHQGRIGLFQDWLASKNKLGGQHKVQRLSNSRDYLEELKAMN
jgi:hypothetical protein